MKHLESVFGLQNELGSLVLFFLKLWNTINPFLIISTSIWNEDITLNLNNLLIMQSYVSLDCTTAPSRNQFVRHGTKLRCSNVFELLRNRQSVKINYASREDYMKDGLVTDQLIMQTKQIIDVRILIR